MKNSFYLFSDYDSLAQHLKSPEICANARTAKTILFQVFSSQTDAKVIRKINETIKNEFHEAVIIGATTIGVILEGIYTSATVISISFFETTIVKSLSFPTYPLEEYDIGLKLIHKIKEFHNDIAGVLLLATPLSINMPDILKGMETENFDFPIFGGGSGVYNSVEQSLIFCGQEFYNQGVIALVFIGKDLHIHLGTYLGWHPLSREMTITDMDGNLVKQIDNEPAFNIYKHYLNLQNDVNFFKNVLEFPFLLKRSGMTVARVPFSVDENGYIEFLSDLKSGDKFHIGYEDPDIIQNQLNNLQNSISGFYPDIIFLYTSICRRYINHNSCDNETLCFNQIAPTFGFYSFGEIWGNHGNLIIHNASIVAVALREGEIKKRHIERNQLQKEDNNESNEIQVNKKSIISKLLYFIKALSSDLDYLDKELTKASGLDKLTQVYCRDKIESLVISEINRAKRYGTGFSLIILSPDTYTPVFDNCNNNVNTLKENILLNIAGILKKNIRRTDSVGRWGDEEFLILLPETKLHQACRAAEKLKHLISLNRFHNEEGITCSFGVSSYHENDEKDFILIRAIKALSDAKITGGDCIEFIDVSTN